MTLSLFILLCTWLYDYRNRVELKSITLKFKSYELQPSFKTSQLNFLINEVPIKAKLRHHSRYETVASFHDLGLGGEWGDDVNNPPPPSPHSQGRNGSTITLWIQYLHNQIQKPQSEFKSSGQIIRDCFATLPLLEKTWFRTKIAWFDGAWSLNSTCKGFPVLELKGCLRLENFHVHKIFF